VEADIHGLILKTTRLLTMTSAPEKTPAAPNPAMARPTMSIAELFATAQISDPSSKTKRKARYAHLREK